MTTDQSDWRVLDGTTTAWFDAPSLRHAADELVIVAGPRWEGTG